MLLELSIRHVLGQYLTVLCMVLHMVLQCGYETGEDRLYLRLPVEVAHVIDDGEAT